VRIAGQYRILDHQHESCFESAFWTIEFGVDSQIWGKICASNRCNNFTSGADCAYHSPVHCDNLWISMGE